MMLLRKAAIWTILWTDVPLWRLTWGVAAACAALNPDEGTRERLQRRCEEFARQRIMARMPWVLMP